MREHLYIYYSKEKKEVSRRRLIEKSAQDDSNEVEHNILPYIYRYINTEWYKIIQTKRHSKLVI